MKEHHDPQAITEAFRLIVGDGNVTELRALNATVNGDRWAGTYSGYFNSPESLANAAATIGTAEGIYFTPNPVNPALLARSNNRLKRAGKGASTGDGDIVRRRWLLIDADAKRPSGISATEVEHNQAIDRIRTICLYLRTAGWPEPIPANSGNGGHLLYGVDLPVDDGGLVQRCLMALANHFDNQEVNIDQTVFNPARIWKLYGTLACKGDSTPDRPHRMANLLHRPDTLAPVPVNLLEALAGEVPTDHLKVAEDRRGHPSAGQTFDLEAFIQQHHLDVDGPEPWTDLTGTSGKRWVFKVCPWNRDHTNGSAFIIQFDTGAIAAGCHHNSCAGKDWHALRDLLDPGWRQRGQGFVGFVSGVRGRSGNNWPEVRLLPDDLPPVKAYESDMLPDPLRAFVDDIAERLQCPPDFPAAATVAVLGSVIGGRCAIRPKRKDDWVVVPNLWGGVIGRPSLLKSPAVKAPRSLLDRLEVDARKDFEAAQRGYEKKALLARARKKAAEQNVEQAVKKGKDPEAAMAILDDPEPAEPEPVRKRYITNDTFVEKLGVILADNPNGVMVFRDELVGWLNSLEKDNQQGARAFYLEAWDGTSRFTYDRITRGTVEIESAIVSVFGCIQPSRLGPYVRSAVDGKADDDGLIQRFQLLVWPDVTGAWRNVDRWPNTEARTQVFNVVERLHGITPEAVAAEIDKYDQAKIPFLRFDEPAQQAFDAWRAKLELRLRSGDEHPAIEAHLGKFRSLIPSLALILHLAEHERGPVGYPALALAIRWAEYLESHARRVYSAATAAEVVAAKAIWRRIVKGDVTDGFSARKIYQKGWTGLTDSEVVKAGLELLVDHGHIVEQEVSGPAGTPGRPRLPQYLINPHAKNESGGTPTDKTNKTNKTNSVGFVSTHTQPSDRNSPNDWGKV